MSDLQTRKIIEHVCAAVSELMDVERFYAALFERTTGQITFPLVWERGQTLPEDQPPWAPRSRDERWPLDLALTMQHPLSITPEGPYRPDDGSQPKSWLAVPVAVGDKNRLALVVENWHNADAFGEDARRILETITGQAAMSLRSIQLVRERQLADQQRRAAERYMAVNRISGELAHSMNNIAGTVPVYIRLARRELDPDDPKQSRVLKHLDAIEKSSMRLLLQAQTVKESTQLRAREAVDVNALIQNAIKQACSSQPDLDERIQVELNLARELPNLVAERGGLMDALASIIRNALESMQHKGSLTISSALVNDQKPVVEIRISDTGVGIKSENLSKIFDPFFTTKDTGMGFGLWRDKTVIEELGGSIRVESVLRQGTTFIITLPVTLS